MSPFVTLFSTHCDTRDTPDADPARPQCVVVSRFKTKYTETGELGSTRGWPDFITVMTVQTSQKKEGKGARLVQRQTFRSLL